MEAVGAATGIDRITQRPAEVAKTSTRHRAPHLLPHDGGGVLGDVGQGAGRLVAPVVKGLLQAAGYGDARTHRHLISGHRTGLRFCYNEEIV